ncbi:DoxX family protein [Oerskovia flava]|uniref:DoxX family protein n=1 Tax=Oerskovia flava TaxID=2986422 RepID=UPI00223EB939|nr:DoxX family protein [Oerskovia sp. JB1-3-2]
MTAPATETSDATSDATSTGTPAGTPNGTPNGTAPGATRRSGEVATGGRTQHDVVTTPAARRALALARVGVALVFLWPFLDKLLGLGYATAPENAWVRGGEPTQGYLQHGAGGPFAPTFAAIAGPVTDWLFMVGLAAVGVALLLGIGVRVAAVAGSLLMALLWVAGWPLAAGSTNPVVDSHVVVILLLAVLALTFAGETWGLGRRWARLPLVRRLPWLR